MDNVIIQNLYALFYNLNGVKSIKNVRKNWKGFQKEIMYDEYMKSELIPGIDRFEEIRNFEKLDMYDKFCTK